MKKSDVKKVHHPKTYSEKFSDWIAWFFGSWWFLIILTVALIIWVFLNTILVIHGKWDPYPFILMNLFLSVISAVFGPIILMSQNREAVIAKRKAENDYRINRLAEREVTNMQKDLDEIKVLIKSIHRAHKKKKAKKK